MISESPRCPRCHAELPRESPDGLCPACVLRLGLDDVAETGAAAAAAPEAPDPSDLTRMFPQLEILDVLGRGGMGVVYRARQRGLDRLVALKILPPGVGSDPAFAERFTREARALARLNHPGIVTVHDFGQVDGLYYFIMEYVDGVNLREVIRRGDLRPEAALALVPQICEALQYAHEEGIVHRDIKPENILMDRRGRVKIADFGLGKLLVAAPAGAGLTGTQQVLGTLHYMAPEQWERPRAVDHRADIYSLGVVFYELLTGELPLGRFAPPSRKVRVDLRLDEVVLRTLEKEPERRYQHAADVKMDLDAIADHPGPGPALDLVDVGLAKDVPGDRPLRLRKRDLPASIRRAMRKRMILTAFVTFLACFGLDFAVFSTSPRPTIDTIAYEFVPNSGSFRKLELAVSFTAYDGGAQRYHEQPRVLPVELTLWTNQGLLHRLLIELPGLQAAHWPARANSAPVRMVLDLEELFNWMQHEAKLDPKDPHVQAEAREIIALLKRYSTVAPSSSEAFLESAIARLTSYRFAGFRGTSTWPFRPPVLVILGNALLMSVSFIILYRINQWGLRRGQELPAGQAKPEGTAAT
jgi:serine/threonine protein kinase